MKFKIGDRVRVYGPGWKVSGAVHGFCEVQESPWPGTVKAVDGKLTEVLRDYDGAMLAVYPQQCRKLVKKKRRRIWADEEFLKTGSGYVWTKPPTQHDQHIFEFVEVKR